MQTILWFRRDLRVDDNKLLAVDVKKVLPIFIFDINILSNLNRDDHRVTFIFNMVLKLKEELKKVGLNLAIFYAKPLDVFKYLKTLGFDSAFASFDYDSYARRRDKELLEIIDLRLINDCYLLDHANFLKDDGLPYKVFTQFYKKSQLFFNESNYLEYKYIKKDLYNFDFEHIIEIKDTILIKKPILLDSIGFDCSKLGEKKSKEFPKKMLLEFKEKIDSYKENRDFLDKNHTSKLSVHLRFGTISIREVVRVIKEWEKEGLKIEPFFRELFWREFYAYILCHFPDSEHKNFLDLKIDWENDEKKLRAYLNGECGVPIVDAAIRELNSTGEMHNRARMIVASFLTKNLHIDWRIGESFFANKLFDYDAASNVGSWQWASSTGTDAQPYFRIFNPYIQAKKFDSNAEYIKRFVPELKDVPNSVLFCEDALFEKKIDNYPKPIIRHAISSKRALELFKKASSNR